MKIRLILLEGKVEDLVKKYPKLQDLYNQGSLTNMKPAYVEWIAKQNEPPEDVIGLIPAFEKNIQRLSVKDINRYTSEELTLALEQLSTKKAPEQIKSEDSTILGQFGPWLVVMPHTTESSCYWGSGTTWCTARTTSQNLFLSYVGRKNENIILYYILNNQTNDDNSKISIGFVNGKPLLSGQGGGVTVNKANKGLNEQDLKNILGEHYEKIINTLQNHSNSIGGKHPAKTEMEALVKNPNKFKKHLSKFKGKEELIDFISFASEYDPIEQVKLIISETFENLIENADNKLDIFYKIVKNNSPVPPQTLDYIAKNTDNALIFSYIAYNKNTSSETLMYILNNNTTNDSVILRNTASNENASPEILDYLAKNTDDTDALNRISYNKNTSPQTLDYLAKNTDIKYIFYNIVSNKNTSMKTLAYIAQSTNDEDVVHAILYNEDRLLTPEILDYLAKNTDNKYISYNIVSNKNISPQTLDYIAKNTDDIQILNQIAFRENTLPQTLDYIAKNTDNKYISYNVSGNKNTSPQTLTWIIMNSENDAAIYKAKENLQKRESKIKLKINLSKLI